MFSDRHHRYGFISREPEGSVIPAGVVTHVIVVAEEEGHRVEPVHTGPGHTCGRERCCCYHLSISRQFCLTQVLVVSLLIALDVEERVAVPELGLARPTERDGG